MGDIIIARMACTPDAPWPLKRFAEFLPPGGTAATQCHANPWKVHQRDWLAQHRDHGVTWFRADTKTKRCEALLPSGKWWHDPRGIARLHWWPDLRAVFTDEQVGAWMQATCLELLEGEDRDTAHVEQALLALANPVRSRTITAYRNGER